jgi:hypothetical protein
MVRGIEGVDKIDSVVNYYVKPLININKEVMADRTTMKGAWEKIVKSFGMGSFMAGQIVADLRWALDGRWRDRLTWAPVGPGSTRGMNRLMGYILNRTYRQEVFEELLSFFIGKCDRLLPFSITSRLEAHDYQNCLCEFDKYERVLRGEGKPKQKYPGGF